MGKPRQSPSSRAQMATALKADDALRVAHHPGERRLGGWILGQRACGVVQDFQRDVAARELLRLLLDPGLEGGVAAQERSATM